MKNNINQTTLEKDIHILCIETSGINCSVAISKNEEILVEKSQNTGAFSHAESLHLFIEEVIEKSGISSKKIDAVSVSQGPGSYTGLRIGVSAAKGLCYAWDVPLITISTLQILACQAKVERGVIIPMLDARRMEVYTTVFSSNYEELSPTESLILNESSFAEYLNQEKVTFLGDGSAKFSEIINHSNAYFIKDAFPEAKDMIPFSFDKFINKEFSDLAYFEPDYLKPFHVNK